ncbi:sodium channel protein Nach-like [Bacillus rossius redtenbacheri]|uniref:sodium channel protein Nach-like n=1 Tax=Bacillus rossius redtenbacheri TaxID=93214 RepID=UPI002FDD3189
MSSRASRELASWCKEFCLVTAQHGFKYLALPRQSLLERIVWLMVLVTAGLSAGSMMCEAWQKSQAHPTLTAIESVHFPIWNMDFPGVSLCSVNKVDRGAALRLAGSLKLPSGHSSEEAYLDLQLLSRLIQPSKDHVANLTRLQVLLTYNNLTTDSVARRVVRRSSGRLAAACGKDSASGMDESPFRTSSCGPTTGLVVVVDNMLDDYFSTPLASYGIKSKKGFLHQSRSQTHLKVKVVVQVLVHPPREFPGEFTDERFLPSGSKMLISVYPVSTYSTPSVLQLDPARRRCYTRSEGLSPGGRHYSFANCFTECQTNLSVELCGCAPVFYPRLGHYKTCNLTDIPCLAENEWRAAATGAPGGHTGQLACDCLPECDQLSYELESSESRLIAGSLGASDSHVFVDVANGICATIVADFRVSVEDGTTSIEFDVKDDKDVIEFTRTGNYVTQTEQILVHVYFIDMVGTRFRTDVIHSWHNLLASFGGLLGIFLGFSMLTCFEATYFFTARVLFRVLRAAPAAPGPPPAFHKHRVGAAPPDNPALV